MKDETFLLNLKQNSPYRKLYDIKIEQWKHAELFQSEGLPQNEYYNPDLFKIIQAKLYIIPLWTGILLNNHTRESNNYVEYWFALLKHKLINRKQILTSEYVNPIYNYI